MNSEWRAVFVVILRSGKDFFLSIMLEAFPWKELARQFQKVVLESSLTILIGGIIQAMFLMWVAGFYGQKFGANLLIGSASIYAIIRESAVVITGILFAGRIGTAFTVEIGSMQMSEQIDALKLMNIDPANYLMIPRVVASMLILPLLTGLSFISAIFFSWFMMAIFWGMSFEIFFQDAFLFIQESMLTNALLRAFVMGFVVALNAVSLGFHPCNGAEDLGKVTTKSVVLNIYCILLIDILLGIFYAIFYAGGL